MYVLGMEPRQASEIEMASLHDLAAMVMSQIELQHALGRVDPLSGLPNHNRFIEDLEDLAKDRPRDERRFVVAVDVANPVQLRTAVRVMGPSFLDDMADERKRSLVSTMILLSHNLGYRVVAEGVESRRVLDIVADAVCDEVQGYLFGHPMIPGDFSTRVRDWVDPRSR